MQVDLSTVESFEICSIRPPTENYSLTFRLTRNCGWNRCLFCPVYKLGARFSRRSMDDVKTDVDRAKAIDDLLLDMELSGIYSSGGNLYDKAAQLVADIKSARPDIEQKKEEGQTIVEEAHLQVDNGDEEEDERLRWFAGWFKETPTIEDSVNHVLSWRMGGGETCFLGDADSLLFAPEYLMEAIHYIRGAFPTLKRFTVYGRTRSAARKMMEDMIAFKEAGLHRIHFGVESGSDKVLAFMKKGVTAAGHIEGCRKTREAGISCSVYVMPGLGGMEWSDEHAIETARVITESGPDFVRLRSLEIFPRTGLSRAVANGEFIEATEGQIAKEIKTLIENIRSETVIVSDSASNLFDINGTLPADRGRMIKTLDEYLTLSPREKLIYSFSSRLHSFMGQYGGVSQDIFDALHPYISDGTINISGADDSDIRKVTRLIRSKLMP